MTLQKVFDGKPKPGGAATDQVIYPLISGASRVPHPNGSHADRDKADTWRVHQ